MKFTKLCLLLLVAGYFVGCATSSSPEPEMVLHGRVIHRFFDTSPISPSGKYIALFRLPYEDKSPLPGDAGEVVVVDLATKQEVSTALTRGWEMQLGANVQWGSTDDDLFYNDVDTTTWEAYAVWLNFRTGEKKKISGTVFMASTDGNKLASYDLRKSRFAQVGYGVIVPNDAVSRNIGPVSDDGVYVTDLSANQCRMIASIRDIYEQTTPSIAIPDPENYEYYCFQVKWNPQGTRLLTTVQWTPKDGGDRRRAVITMKSDGTDICTAITPEQWSKGGHHVNWMPDGEHLSMNLNIDGKEGIEMISVKYDGSNLREVYPVGSGHPSFHPRLPYIITDAYAGEMPLKGDQSPIRLIDVEHQTETVAAEVYLPPIRNFEFRVDAHPVWDRTGRYVVYNGVKDDTRGVYLLDLGYIQSDKSAFTILCSPTITDTLNIPVSDLQSYITHAVPFSGVTLSKTDSKVKPVGHLIVMVDRNDATINQLCKQYKIGNPPTEWNSFRITSFVRKDDSVHNIYFLEGADSWGKQYAVYDFAERFLGVKYLKPETDYIRVQPDFSAQLINTEIQKPDYEWRGLYPWHYNYESRGLTTFCDINARFVNQDWKWFCQLGDWMVKNKQNAILWFDDVFSHENISGQFPDSLSDYYASRGIKQILGLGWASNEDLSTGGDWKRKICLDDKGKSVEDAAWKRSICPQSKAYFQLADINFANMKLDKPQNYIGALIGYGENTWASKEAGVNCVLHSGTPSSEMMLRDLNYVADKFKSVGLGDLPLGFVTSTHSIHAGNPFETDNLIDNIPPNAIFSMHTYQQSGWKQFQNLYSKIDQRNKAENTSIKAFQIAEAAFICGADIPLLKPSILRRRSEHFNTLPKENTLGHLATLNTTQYLYWYNTYQLLKWQWHKDETKWDEDNLENFTCLFGKGNGEKLNDIFNRLACLEYVLPYTSLDSLLNSVSDLRPPVQWGRYNQKTHPDNVGFLLWAEEKDIENLDDAEKSIAAIIQMNEELLMMPDTLYRLEFYPTVRLTANYYAIRVAMGKYSYYLNHALMIFKTKGWNDDVENQLNSAKTELNNASASLKEYNRLFLELLKLKEPLTPANKADIQRDFVFNPSHDFLNWKLAETETCIKNKIVNISVE